jgi:uncharacterized protein YbjT (DUF2867 family)
MFALQFENMILVTGATGFIGQSLVHALESQGRSVKPYTGKLNDALALPAELVGVESIIHLAGAETHGRIRLLKRVDIEGTERLLAEAGQAGVKKIIVISRLNADPNSVNPLLRAKGYVERQVRHSEMPYTIVRSGTLFGRRDRFLNVIAGMAAWSWPFVGLPGGGRVAMQPLWVEDLVRCLVACLDRPDLTGKTVELVGEERLRYEKLVRPLNTLVFGLWRRPPVTRFYMDRFTVPEVAPVDAVYQTFGFRPGLLSQHIAYLRGPGLRRRLFRLD